MRAPAGIVLVLALAPPASAETVARRTVAAGPAFAGDTVAWGQETRGAVQVLRGAPGTPPRVVHEIPAASAPKTRRGFMSVPSSFAASDQVFAALTLTATVIQEGSDSVSEASEQAAIGGPLQGPGQLLGGTIPERVGDGCTGRHENVSGVDVDADRIAVARSAGECGRDAPPRLSISIHDATGRRDVPVPGSVEIITVRIAGDYLLWVARDPRYRDELVLYDLARGAELRRVRLRDLGARDGRNAVLQADGTVAFTFSRRRGNRLAWFSAAEPRLRVLDPGGFLAPMALDGGRLLYQRSLRARSASEVAVRRLGSGKPRRLARYGRRRGVIGTMDLDGNRATWAVEPRRPSDDQPTGRPGRIVLRTL